MGDQKRDAIKKLFDDSDTSGDDALTQKELLVVLKKLCGDHVTADDVVEYFSQNDKNDDNKISFEEFYRVFKLRDNKDVSRGEVEELFKKKDTDGSGFIDTKEFHAIFTQCKDYSAEKIDAVLKACDKDHDGKINFSECIKAFYG